MNNRKIKLALTVGLMNSNSDPNVVGSIKHTMLGFKEVGSYLGLSVKGNARLNHSHIQETYAFEFENCTLNVDVISDGVNESKLVKSFELV